MADFAELTRMRGGEDIAKELGHVGSFVTLTCPSKYHCAYASYGEQKPNWNGATSYQAQQHLNQFWAPIRAELARQEIQIYGLRVAELQHDGTPHWHMMLCMAPEHLSAFRTVFMQYALAEDGDEKGAQENRVKLVDIDLNKGSTTGYIAMYISKNIDGERLGEIDGVVYWKNAFSKSGFSKCSLNTLRNKIREVKKIMNENPNIK